MYLHSSIAYFSNAAFPLVKRMGSLWIFKDMSYHKGHSGAVDVIRQSGIVLDIASARLNGSHRALGFSSSIVSIYELKAFVGRPTLAKLALSWAHCV